MMEATMVEKKEKEVYIHVQNVETGEIWINTLRQHKKERKEGKEPHMIILTLEEVAAIKNGEAEPEAEVDEAQAVIDELIAEQEVKVEAVKRKAINKKKINKRVPVKGALDKE